MNYTSFLSEIFIQNISKNHEISFAYFNYIDLVNDTLIESNRPEDFKMTRYIKTDTLPLDIANSIGIVGFVEAPRWIILDKMKTQLRLSILLIVIAVVSLIYISRSFIFQLKTEKMRQESVNTMTHEFKRPISSAVAMASVIPFYLENKDQGKVLEYVENVETELNKLTFYTNRIQQISNNQKGKVALDIREVKIVPFFESLKQRYATIDQDKQEIALNVHVHTEKDAMYVDLLHFSNVMDNLIENAIKYTVEPTILIDIQLRDRDDDGLEVSVKDNGIGISPKDIKYVFDKYYRVRRAETRNKTGYGLGLTYVESIVNAHGGSISVSSNLNRGSEFTIQLKRQLNGRIDTVG